MTYRRAITALAIAAVFLAACGAARLDSGASAIDGAWRLESGNLDGEPIPLVSGYRITFTAAGSGFSGTAACNGYGGLFAIEAWELSLNQLNITEMACIPEVMESEAAYIVAMQRVNLAALDGEALELSGPGVELRYILLPSVPEEALIGTVWVLEGLIDGDSISTVLGENLTLDLRDDGTLTAMTGCRILTGTYAVGGDEIQTPELSAEGECTAELSAQDSRIVTVFEGGFTVEIVGNSLTLTAAGNEGLRYRADL